MMEIAKAFVVGVVSIGAITALFAPGRTTVSGINALANGGAKVLGVAESGHN